MRVRLLPQTKTLMNNPTTNEYLAPEVDMLAVSVERGFDGTNGNQLPKYEEDDDEIVLG